MTSTTIATNLEVFEQLLDYFSDLYKEVNGFRPRGRFTRAQFEADPQGTLDALNAAIAAVSHENDILVAQAQADRAAFTAKVAALGLDPAKYMELAE